MHTRGLVSVFRPSHLRLIRNQVGIVKQRWKPREGDKQEDDHPCWTTDLIDVI